MNSKINIIKIIQIAGALGSFIGGLITLVTLFGNQSSSIFEYAPKMFWVTASILLLFLGYLGLAKNFTRRSYLLCPEKLRLHTNKVEHLVGREEDVKKLLQHCIESQQVYLIGESGCGKSALIQAGLQPTLQNNNLLFPIYMNIWGQDWEKGPRIALIDTLWANLSKEQKNTLRLRELPQKKQLFILLRRLKPKLGRTPLIIFDQFDDYQARHHDKFLPCKTKTWLSASQLITQNSFWAEIKQLLDDNVIHCLFVTRNDSAIGLDAIRFQNKSISYQIEYPPYQLDLLRVHVILPLLETLTKSDDDTPVISNPTRGWERLKEKLANDLSQDGFVLAIQMRMALLGLEQLRYLTVSNYEKEGRLQGLEATHIEWHIANTARHTGLSKEKIRQLLIALVDSDTQKTVPQTTTWLANRLGINENAGKDQALLQEALNNLEAKEIIRKRLDPDTRNIVWSLIHDYLCRGVLMAERRANRWTVLLQEKEKTFKETGWHIWRKWKTLLPIWQQIQLFFMRILGRFHYDCQRKYAIWSMGRFLPYGLLFIIIWVITLDYLDWREIKIVDGIELENYLSNSKPEDLWILTPSGSFNDYLFDLTVSTWGHVAKFVRKNEKYVSVGKTSAQPDLSITINDNSDPVPMQGTVNYTIRVSLDDNARSKATGVQLITHLPVGIGLKSIITDYGNCDTKHLPKITCFLNDIAPSNFVTINLTSIVKDIGLLIFSQKATVTANEYPPSTVKKYTQLVVPIDIRADVAIVIDVTNSMQEEREGLIKAVSDFIKEISKDSNPTITLITFRDEVSITAFTKDQDVLIESMKRVKFYGGGSCPEASVEALNMAISHVKEGGYILLATDASPYDTSDIEATSEFIQKKDIKLTPIITGDCSGQNSLN